VSSIEAYQPVESSSRDPNFQAELSRINSWDAGHGKLAATRLLAREPWRGGTH
jgi:hypothetical protein